ncbi:MAG TPA: [FeFe] hydrogenase H-cluster maturation GTPase HydF [Alphaproteobacteria bacterium]|nr:[FeFe] hydrogenase H-cluster maturation GTPase HydF [Alphaproteobacteria bacterium]
MRNTPKGLRLQIAILGKVNAGKSSFLNLMVGQEVSIVSEVKGTTTDVVEKAQELHPLGPVLWLDTAGFGDETALSDKRLEKTIKVLDRADVAVLVCDEEGKTEKEIEELVANKNIPLIKVVNKKEKCDVKIMADKIELNALDLTKRAEAVLAFEQLLLRVCPEDFLTSPAMLSDLAPKGGLVLMIVPIDYEAPKGRLIMPQVQAIRDCLDGGQMIMIVKETEYLQALKSLSKSPDLVVCDSQVVKFMVDNTPRNVKCTTFSVLMARLKGDLNVFTAGAEAIWRLKDGDKVLIAESCTHHAADDDIGTVKIPNLMKKKTGKNLVFEHVSGCDFKTNLKDYKLIVQCGGCTQNRRAILSRIAAAQNAGVPITNYGICLSELNGVLARVNEPFVR